MRDMEGKICDIKWKSKVCPQKSQFWEKIYRDKYLIKIRAWNETRPTYYFKRYWKLLEKAVLNMRYTVEH